MINSNLSGLIYKHFLSRSFKGWGYLFHPKSLDDWVVFHIHWGIHRSPQDLGNVVQWSSSALVHSICCNKHHSDWLMNNRKLLRTVLESGRPRSKYQHGRGLMRALLLAHTQHVLLCPHRLRTGLSRSFYKRALIPSRRAESSPKYILKTHLPRPSHWG